MIKVSRDYFNQSGFTKKVFILVTVFSTFDYYRYISFVLFCSFLTIYSSEINHFIFLDMATESVINSPSEPQEMLTTSKRFCTTPFVLRHFLRRVIYCHWASKNYRNMQNLFYRTRKPQKYDNSGVLWNHLVGPDGLEPPTKGLSLSVPIGMHECDSFNETDKSVILISKLSNFVYFE